MRSKKTANVTAAFVFAGCWASAGIAQADPEPPPAPKTTIDSDGTYVVGADILPGMYTSAGPAGDTACYWKRVNGTEIVGNALTKKPQVVQIEPTDTAFTTSHCQPWQLSDCAPGCAPPVENPLGLLGDLGAFLIPRLGTVAPGGNP